MQYELCPGTDICTPVTQISPPDCTIHSIGFRSPGFELIPSAAGKRVLHHCSLCHQVCPSNSATQDAGTWQVSPTDTVFHLLTVFPACLEMCDALLYIYQKLNLFIRFMLDYPNKYNLSSYLCYLASYDNSLLMNNIYLSHF